LALVTKKEVEAQQEAIQAMLNDGKIYEDQAISLMQDTNSAIYQVQLKGVTERAKLMEKENADRVKMYNAMIAAGARAMVAEVAANYKRVHNLRDAGNLAINAIRAGAAAEISSLADSIAAKIELHGAEAAAAAYAKGMEIPGPAGWIAAVAGAASTLAWYTALAATVAGAGAIAAHLIAPPSAPGSSEPGAPGSSSDPGTNLGGGYGAPGTLGGPPAGSLSAQQGNSTVINVSVPPGSTEQQAAMIARAVYNEISLIQAS
jgi:hypothetical protein